MWRSTSAYKAGRMASLTVRCPKKTANNTHFYIPFCRDMKMVSYEKPYYQVAFAVTSGQSGPKSNPLFCSKKWGYLFSLKCGIIKQINFLFEVRYEQAKRGRV
jgi:hypothetical protein